MAREGLRFELGNAFQKALRQKEAVKVRDLKVGTNGGSQIVDVTVQQIAEPQELSGMVMIIFSDAAPPTENTATGRSRKSSSGNARVLELEQELQQTREGLQITREEMQSSQEELKSTKEKLQAANEKPQSTHGKLNTHR